MNFDLSVRQRAMLLEMGVHVWWPVPAASASASMPASTAHHASPAHPDSVPAAPHQATTTTHRASPTVRSVPAAIKNTGLDVTADRQLPCGIAGMDWQALGHAVADCQACAMCAGRRLPVLGTYADGLQADWMVLGDPPDEAQERAGQPFVEDAGQLLDRMLWAVGVTRYQPGTLMPSRQTAYLTPVLKCRPASTRVPDATELATCAHYLQREIALVQPKVILAMGRFAMQLLLSQTPPELAKRPLGQLRGQVYRYLDVPVIVCYPPGYLLRNGLDKARAWADLCLAADVVSA